ncbi:MAG: type III-B CRISPR module-associated protein Cmr5 [Caldilineaceae bacterium]|nr:type III-B CRISPR module-associated protein Cmr5 [Caldilineaceae bacterium]
MQTRSQKYAKKIYAQVCEIEKMSEEERKKYGSMAHKLPVLVRTAGLAQALAFVDARSSAPAKTLLDHLASILQVKDKSELLKQSRENGLAEYMHLTQNVLIALVWYKRFAQSVLGIDASEAQNVGEGDAGS